MKIIIIILSVICFTVAFAQTKKAIRVAQTDSYKRGKEVYAKVCLSCHQIDGGGVPKLNPPLINTDYVLGNKQKLIFIVLKGMNDRIPIDDEYYSNFRLRTGRLFLFHSTYTFQGPLALFVATTTPAGLGAKIQISAHHFSIVGSLLENCCATRIQIHPEY